MIRRVLAVTAAIAVVLAGSVMSRAGDLDAQRAEAMVQLAELSTSLQGAQMRTDHLRGAIEIAQDATEDRAAVLAVRPAFMTEVAALRDSLGAAEGKMDTATVRASALSAQQTVLDERDDPAVVVAATATVRALVDEVGQHLATWESSRAHSDGPVWSASGPDGYARVRAALDRVGGTAVGLYESASCGGGTAPACANSNGYIKYRADIADWSAERLDWAMAHELAHIHQFQVWGALTSSPGYRSLFGGDPEFLANCMAAVRGFPGSVGCNGQQQEWASRVWVGVVG